ncbi:MAG: hypothetical protein KJO24_01465 [Gammaproteobacteria bacterium]|nr:hypothetical protein [Gammaproteobacteria bacterium]
MRQGNPPSNPADSNSEAGEKHAETSKPELATPATPVSVSEPGSPAPVANDRPAPQLYSVPIAAPLRESAGEFDSVDNPADGDSTDDETADELPSNVINLFTGQALAVEASTRIIRISGECNGARMLYSTLDNPERLVAVPILCWALLEDGAVTALVPWLDEVLPCEEIEEKYSINWEGYYCSIVEDFFFEPPAEVVAQLGVAARFNRGLLNAVTSASGNAAAAVEERSDWHIVQEIPDPVGTHALLLNESSDALVLTSVISWTLDEYGRLHGMLADDASIEKLPVLPGDDCLFCAEDEPSFKCFFQRDIAEQIRTQNPETMQAIEQLFGSP